MVRCLLSKAQKGLAKLKEQRERERCKCSRFPSSSVSNEIAFCNEEELKNTVIPMKKKKCQHSGYYCCKIGVMI
jgi:hypothetical protein